MTDMKISTLNSGFKEAIVHGRKDHYLREGRLTLYGWG